MPDMPDAEVLANLPEWAAEVYRLSLNSLAITRHLCRALAKTRRDHAELREAVRRLLLVALLVDSDDSRVVEDWDAAQAAVRRQLLKGEDDA